jgi:sec-independent protein translocase protein TatC
LSEYPFIDFLAREIGELRRRLLICLGALALASTLMMGYPSWDNSWALQLLGYLQTHLLPQGVHLVFLDPLEPMAVAIKLSLGVSLLACLPLLLWHFVAFTAPALAKGMRAFYIRFTILSVLFIAAGLALTYAFMLPLTLKMLLAYGQVAGGVPMITFDRFYSFCVLVLLAFALPFETPILMGFLQRFNFVEAKTFREHRLKAFGLIMIVSQLVTPDPIITPSIFCAVSFLLYEVGIWMGSWL